MDATTMLEEDHRKVEKLMQQIEKTTERGVKTREELFTTLMEELVVHEKIEEQILYPAVKERGTSKQITELVEESYEEHHFVHHAKEEEEQKLFPKVRRAFSKPELEELGTRMRELKQTLPRTTETPEEQGVR